MGQREGFVRARGLWGLAGEGARRCRRALRSPVDAPALVSLQNAPEGAGWSTNGFGLGRPAPRPGLPTPTAHSELAAFGWAESGHWPACGAPGEGRGAGSRRPGPLAPLVLEATEPGSINSPGRGRGAG